MCVCLLRFVEKYRELESRGDVKPEILLEETARALLADGVVLRRRGGERAVSCSYEEGLHTLYTSDVLVVYYGVIYKIIGTWHVSLCLAQYYSVKLRSK